MKTLKYILLTLIATLAFASCTDDDKTIFDPNNAKPGELISVKSSYKLLSHKSDRVIETFQWGKMDFGFQAAINYSLELDLAGQNFANPATVFTTNDLAKDVTVGELNAAMMNLQAQYGFADYDNTKVEFRIRGGVSEDAQSGSVYSNVVESNIISYPSEPTYPMIRIVGDYCGWSHGNAMKLFSFEKNDIYEGWIFFDAKAANGFKVSGGTTDWNTEAGNWGLKEGDAPSSEATSLNLWSDGGSKNIDIYSKKYYKFSFNKATAELKVLASMNSSLTIKGTATGGKAIELGFDASQQAFSGNVSLLEGDFMITGENMNLGQGTDAGSLVDDGKAIVTKAGDYQLSVILNNSNDLKFRMKSASPLDPNLVTPQTLNALKDLSIRKTDVSEISWSEFDFGYQDLAKVTYTVEMDLAGSNFAKAQKLATLEGSENTTTSIAGSTYLNALTELGKGLDEEVEVEVRIAAKVSNSDEIFYSNIEKFKLKVTAPPLKESNLYMIGNKFGDWGWQNYDVVAMTPVWGYDNKETGMYWTIQYLDTDTQFKWSGKRDWDGSFNAKDTNIGFIQDGGNAKVEAAGLYMIFVDLANSKICIEPANIYGIGDVFGGWDAGKYPLNISDSKVSATAVNKGELRMHATSSIQPSDWDWWKMEFVIIDGEIEYRGNGGDQTRVSVEAGQTITLDFSSPNPTGSIK